MRALLLVILGLAVGAVGATMIGNALRLRDAYPRSVMMIMQHHLAALRQDARSPACKATALRRHLERLAAVAPDIEPAFGADSGPLDKGFADAARALRQSIDSARAAPGTTCQSLAPAVARVAQRCDDCHQRYR